MNLYFQVIGYIGSFMLSILLIPQILTIIKTKEVNNISLLFLIFQLVTTILWITYGIGLYLDTGLSALPVIISNSSLFIKSIILLYLKKYYQK